jgi:hypothetical protein
MLVGFDGSGNGTEIDPAAAVWTSADRTALAATSTVIPSRYLRESGREGLFVWSSANNATNVTNDPQQGVYVAPASDTTGASGAWVRKYTGPKNLLWFGAAIDGATDDKVAIQAWLDSGGWILHPGGNAKTTVTPILRRTVHLQGNCYGADDLRSTGGTLTPSAQITSSAGVGGLDIQPQVSTLTWPAGAATQEGAYGSTIENIQFKGSGGATATGIYCRTFIHFRNVTVSGFSGKGFDLSASATDPGDGNSEYGNLSNSTLDECAAISNGSHGLHIRGIDANTCSTKNFTAQLNGGWGILNESFIGNEHDKPNLATNTLGAIKAVNAAKNLFSNPNIETGTGNNIELSGTNVVTGVDLSSINAGAGAGTPSYYASTTTLVSKILFQNTWSPGALAAESALSYRYDGLYLQGRGSLKDVSLVNQAGNVAAFVPTNSTNFEVLGTSFANIFQSLGNNQAMPGLASGYFALIPHVTYGAMLGGSGATGDTTLTNSSGTASAYVPHGTTNLTIVGNAAAANLSGTNTGDQTITLTGNVTGTGTGSFATTIAPGVVTLAMQANMATASVVYRKTAGSGAPEVQTLATLKTDLGLTGTNSGDQTSIVGITGTIAQFNTACTDADFVPTGLATASGLTMTTGKLLGRSTAATGAIEELTALPAANFPALTGDVTTVAAALATTIAANAVTYAKFQQVAASSLVGNATGSLANATGITLAGDTEHLLSSPANAERLRRSIKGPFKSIQELWNETAQEPVPQDMLDMLKELP